MQRALGPSVNVGHKQINMPVRRLGDQWFSRLSKVLERFQVFQARLQVLAQQETIAAVDDPSGDGRGREPSRPWQPPGADC